MDEVMQAARAKGFPAPIFIHRASVEAADAFFGSRAPEARAIADPDGTLFGAFGLQRGTLGQLLGPAVWWRGLRAMLKGNFVGRPTGNETQMPGAFLVRGREILWQHRARHAGDHPDLGAMLRALDPAAATGSASGSTTSSPKTQSLEKLIAEHRRLLAAARDVQRNGDLRTYATMMEHAAELERQIDAAEEQRT
jgi:hypothetical protein